MQDDISAAKTWRKLSYSIESSCLKSREEERVSHLLRFGHRRHSEWNGSKCRSRRAGTPQAKVRPSASHLYPANVSVRTNISGYAFDVTLRV